MIDIKCSRDGLKCEDCPIIKECEHIELTEEIDAYSLYEKGRAEAIDEYVKLFIENALIDESKTWTEYARKVAEQLKEQR